MNRLTCLLLIMFLPLFAAAQQKPDWAFPVADKAQPPTQEDPAKLHTAPGSTLSLTRVQIDDIYNVPDWFPDLHPVMPKIVQHGNQQTKVRACGSCHLPTGTGHDESAWLAGLPISYFMRQMADFKSGDRKGSGTMTTIAKAISEEEIKAAANYFASLPPRPWIRVVETETVAKTYVAKGNKRLRHPDGGAETLGNRIIELPEEEEIVLNRDPRSGFIAYVPVGSIDLGKKLVTTGGDGKTDPCAMCHGETLHGSGDIPALAGRHPNYIVRQLWNFQHGDRSGDSNEEMKIEISDLTLDDMLVIAAYLASLAP